MSPMAQTDTCPTASAVELRHVTKTFTQWRRGETTRGVLRNLIRPEKETVRALDDVSFSIAPGEFVAYAGPNGAGKSTTMKLLGGMLRPGGGEVSVLSMSPAGDRRALMARLGILFGNRTELWWDHPIIQSFAWKKVVWDIPDEVYRRNLDMVTELLDLGGILKTFARELSLGQRMRADLAFLLLHSPEVILLDEPTLGLDVSAKRQMISSLRRLNRELGVTIVVTSHDMADLEEMAERILMLSGGRLAYDGTFTGLRDITGSPTRLTVTAEGAGSPPQLAGCRLVDTRNGTFVYETDLNDGRVGELLGRLAAVPGIRDVEIQKAPIEQIIDTLYQNWRKNRG